MEYIALILSIIAIATDVFMMKKNHKYTVKDKYFSEIFDEIIISKIPNAYIKITDNFEPSKMFELNKDLLDSIQMLRNKIYFFRFVDEIFYDKVNSLLINLDENVHNYCGSSHQNYHQNKISMDACIKELYVFVNNYNLQ